MPWKIGTLCLCSLLLQSILPFTSEAADPQVLKQRVPQDQIAEARAWVNPFPATPENIGKGKKIFDGKAFCVTCHGRDGKGLGKIPGLVGKLPRNFTDKDWQTARTDGELLWILKTEAPVRLWRHLSHLSLVKRKPGMCYYT